MSAISPVIFPIFLTVKSIENTQINWSSTITNNIVTNALNCVQWIFVHHRCAQAADNKKKNILCVEDSCFFAVHQKMFRVTFFLN